MSKRPSEGSSSEHLPKKRKGFSVGPANLPDGTYKRKTQKIKKDLIEKAKVKKAYAKIKANEQENATTLSYDPYKDDEDTNKQQNNIPGEISSTENTTPSAAFHPERQAMLDEPEAEPDPEPSQRRRRNNRPSTTRNGATDETDVNGFKSRKHERQNRPARYRKEFEQAQERKVQMEARLKARDLREKDRKAMAKARRPGKDGRMKLGRQGTVLLGRVKRLQSEGKI